MNVEAVGVYEGHVKIDQAEIDTLMQTKMSPSSGSVRNRVAGRHWCI